MRSETTNITAPINIIIHSGFNPLVTISAAPVAHIIKASKNAYMSEGTVNFPYLSFISGPPSTASNANTTAIAMGTSNTMRFASIEIIFATSR